jgi:hypothetical protein
MEILIGRIFIRFAGNGRGAFIEVPQPFCLSLVKKCVKSGYSFDELTRSETLLSKLLGAAIDTDISKAYNEMTKKIAFGQRTWMR